MKIRNGYVSNSSSSSFLVCYRDDGALGKVKTVMGYERLAHDLNSESPEDPRVTMMDFIRLELGENADSYSNRACGCPDDFLERSDEFHWGDLCETVGYEDPVMPELMSRIHDLGRRFLESVGDGEISWRDPRIEEFRKDCEKVMEGASRAVDGLLSSEQAKGWTFRSVEYEDHDREGSYMEHGFMPFLERYPENDLAVYGLGNH